MKAPESMKSILSALYLTSMSLSGYLFSLLLYIVDAASSATGRQWVSDNLNEGHVDWLYCLLLGKVLLFVTGG